MLMVANQQIFVESSNGPKCLLIVIHQVPPRNRSGYPVMNKAEVVDIFPAFVELTGAGEQ